MVQGLRVKSSKTTLPTEPEPHNGKGKAMAIREAYTAKEVAPLLGLTERAVLFRAQRESWQSRKRAGRGGGREWLVASMPEKTQLAIRSAEERRALESVPALAEPSVPQLPALTQQALLDDKRRYRALAKADLVGLYLDWQAKYGTTVEQKQNFIFAYQGGAWSKLLAELGPRVSWKSLERWKLEQSRAKSVLALADKRGLAHKGKSMLTEQHKTIILGQVLHTNAPQISQCARRIQQRCKAEGLCSPSEDTIRRWVNAYTRECFDEWTLWREGRKAWNDRCAISILRDWSLVDVGDVVIADGHTLNFETLDPDTGKPKRMTLLLFFDGASRYPLGWEVMPSENVACISSAFRRTCLLLGKYPRVVYLDNGKAFRARFFEGCQDFEQAGFLGLYRDLGCEIIHAWPYHGQSKPVERFFGTMHDLEVAMPSYTGWDIAHKPARLHRNEKLHQRLHEKLGGRPLTLQETHEALARWFAEYAARPQATTHLRGRTPAEVFQAGVGPGVDPERLTLMMLQKVVRTISKDGIRLNGRLYWHEALSRRRHPVLVRYDDQLSPYTVLVYDLDGTPICEARDRQHYQIAAGIHPVARVLGTAEQQRDLSDALELKKTQERAAMGNLRLMAETIVLPEARQRQLAAVQHSLPAPAPAHKVAALSAADKAAIEAAKSAGAQARAALDAPAYTPSGLKRFPDEAARYEYIFKAKYEQGVELVADDAAYMEVFEQSQMFQRNYKARFDAMLELYHFRQERQAV